MVGGWGGGGMGGVRVGDAEAGPDGAADVEGLVHWVLSCCVPGDHLSARPSMRS